MPNMSFYHTTTAVRNRTKTHTLRKGWKYLKPGQQFQACVQVRGIRTEDLEVLAQCRCVSVTRRPLNSITPDEVRDEGFPGWTPAQFVQWFCVKMKCQPTLHLRFIRFEYLD